MTLVRAELDTALLSATVTLHAQVGTPDGGLSVWSAPESWPIQLDHGVTLEAPDVDFLGTVSTIFWVTDPVWADGGDGQGAVTIRGEAGHPLMIGVNGMSPI